MHLALVRREMTLHRSGAERMCVNLLRHAVEMGHRVTVVAEQFDPELRAGAAFLPVLKNRWSGWSKTQAFAQAAASVLRQHSFDVVHGLARVPGLDCFHTLDPIQAHWLTVQYGSAWRARLASWNPRQRSILNLERMLYGPRGPRQIIVQSAFDQELLRSLYDVADDRITVVPNGVDLTEFSLTLRDSRPQICRELQLDETRPFILFAGMDFRRKGLETLIRAIPLLSNPDAAVLVAGAGPVPHYAHLASQLGIAHRVRFLGQVRRMAALYVAADVLALPTRYDPFASVVLEALACGTPVVTSRCGGGAEAIREPLTGAVIHDPRDCEELAAALDWQLAQTADRTAACAAQARRFTAESYARQTLQVLHRMTGRRAA